MSRVVWSMYKPFLTGCGPNDSRLVAVLGFLGFAGFLAWMMALGRFADVDECWYKETGRQWAINGRWANPTILGFMPGLEVPPEVVHFTQPPVYAFLFGLFVKVAGFGWRQCVFFDAIIRMGLALILGRAVRKIGGPLIPTVVSWAISWGFLLVNTRMGRPDALAVCFGVCGLLLLQDQPLDLRRIVGSGVLFGLCTGTNLVGGCIMGMIAVPLILLSSSGWRSGFVFCALWATVTAIILGMIVAPILVAAPGCIMQFLAHGRIHAGERLTINVILEVLKGHGSMAILLAGTGLATLFTSVSSLRIMNRQDWLRLWSGPALALATWFVLSSRKEYYLIFVALWLFVLTAGQLGRQWDWFPRRVRRLSAGTLAAILLLVGSQGVKDASELFLPTHQSPAWNERWLQSVIPPGSKVVASQNSWWFLMNERVVFDGTWAGPDMTQVDYVVLTRESFYSKSTAGYPQPPTFQKSFGPLKSYQISDHFRLLASNFSPEKPGFGAMVFERIPADLNENPDVAGDPMIARPDTAE